METKNLAGSLLKRMITPEMKRTQDMIENEKYSEPLNIIATEEISEDDECRVNPLSEVTPPPSLCKISNMPTFTAGNFVMINGKAKSGKTFFLGAIVASCLNNSLQLGNIKGYLPEGQRNVLYFDTEQSKFHINRSIKRICQLAGNENPGNLFAYGIRRKSTKERIAFIIGKLKSIPEYSIVVIDGIRDLLEEGINDESGATELTELFMQASEEFNCCIILILHQNKTNDKARGHIGTEMINKSETVIAITKDEKTNIFTVSSQESRDLSFSDFCFIISDGIIKPVAMPVKPAKKESDPDTISEQRHQAVIDEIFESEPSYTSADFKEQIKLKFKIGLNATRDFVKYYEEKKYVTTEKKGKFSYYSIPVNS
jgi:hypothetical protein